MRDACHVAYRARLVDQNIALLAAGLANHVTQPRIALPRLSRASRSHVEYAAFHRAFCSICSRIFRRILLRRIANACGAGQRLKVDGVVYPLSASTVIFSRNNTFRIAATRSACLIYQWSRVLPYKLRTQTTTELTPDEIHEIGLREVKRIRGEMDKTIQATGFKGSFADSCEIPADRSTILLPRAGELVTGYRDICKRTDAELPRLFGKLPRTPYGVKEIDAYNAPSQTTAFYEPGR